MNTSAAVCPHDHSDADPDQKSIADTLNAYATTTACCHALAHTVLNPITVPPESWWTDLKSDLTGAQAHAHRWLTDIAPRLGSGIPQAILDYGDTFTAATTVLLTILGRPAFSSQDQREVIQIVEAVLESVEAQVTSIANLRADVKTLQNDLFADYHKLTENRARALAAAQLATSESVTLETKIAQLQNQLSSARQNLMVSGIATGAAIFIAVAAFALAVGTGGAGLIVAGAVGIVGLGVAATFTGIFNADAMRLSHEVAEQQSLLDEKQRQAGALFGLGGTLDELAAQLKAADAALVPISTKWKTIHDETQEVANSVRKAASQETFSRTMTRFYLNPAQKKWEDLRCLARQAQHLAAGIQLQPVLQHPTLATLY